MEINAIRMNNYRTLFERFRERPEEKDLPEHGLSKRFADYCGVSARYLAHITHGRKKFSESVARQMEVGLALPLGWMDNVHDADEGSASEAEREFVNMAMQLYRENPVDVQRVMMHYMMSRPTKR